MFFGKAFKNRLRYLRRRAHKNRRCVLLHLGMIMLDGEGFKALLPVRSDGLPRADFVILTVPHTVYGSLMNRARFQSIKRYALFINIGHVMTTRLDDLVAALDAGEIAGAAK